MSKRILFWLLAGLCVVVWLGANRLFHTTKGVEVLLAVYRDAMLLNDDEPNPQRLMGAGISGMLRELDPYALYIPDESTEQFQVLTTGEYAGVGAIIQQGSPYVTVQQLYEGAPAAVAGLLPGDSIVSIDGESMRGKGTPVVSGHLRGKVNSGIEVVVRRPYVPDTLRFSFRRAQIHIDPITYAHRYEDGVAYVQLSSFTAGCAEQVRRTLRRLEALGDLRGVVLDLRGNVGGLLGEGIKLAGFFLPKGDTVVMVKGRSARAEEATTVTEAPPYPTVPLAVLVNRESASSSEVVAGALQDRDRALIIGERTFGKGLVQTTRPLPYGGILKLTTAKYYTPSGRCIQALDYSKRDRNGAVGEVPDSLTSAFRTRHGRTVFDGGGIWPDVPISEGAHGSFVSFLVSHPSVFDYATRYRNAHDSIGFPETFRLSAQDMRAFLAYLHEREVAKESPLLGMIEQLNHLTRDQEQHSLLAPHLKAASRAVIASFDSCFYRHHEEIRELVSEEVVSRYHFARGRLAHALQRDTMLRIARHYLVRGQVLDSILTRVSPADSRAGRMQ